MTRGITMSVKVDQYLQFRRALGYRLRIEGELLQQFAAYADATGRRGPLTVELALRWARLPEGCDRLYWARRLEVVRCFARYLSATEPHTEVPARGLLGPAHRRTTPHIYTDVELSSLISAARRLKPSAGLRPRTYATLIGLLACTGLRISEALKLVQSDVDLGHRVLKIRETKFRKTRLVPVHPTAVGRCGLTRWPATVSSGRDTASISSSRIMARRCHIPPSEPCSASCATLCGSQASIDADRACMTYGTRLPAGAWNGGTMPGLIWHMPSRHLGLSWSRQGQRHVLVSDGYASPSGPGCRTVRVVRSAGRRGGAVMTRLHQPPGFAVLIRDFFCERLLNQQSVSPHTVAAYRDTFRLLLAFLQKRRRRSPTALTLDDIDGPTVLQFLNDLESRRHNSVRTRNARLTAIRAFITYATTRDPTALPLAQRVLAIPQKRCERPLLGHLTRAEIEAVLGAPDRREWSGRRDRALFVIMYNTGARVSEAIGLRRNDLTLNPIAAVRVHGKGRKDRCVPLWKTTAAVMDEWMTEIGHGEETPLFPNRRGLPLSRSGVEERLHRAVTAATDRCPSLRSKNVSPHTLRHTTAMHLLQAGVDVTVIALWLGHENPNTTHQYVEADVEMKRRILGRLEEPLVKNGRRAKKDKLLDFLDGL